MKYTAIHCCAVVVAGVMLGSAAHADPIVHQYTVRLHHLNVSRTRAKQDDTLSVSMSATVNGTMLPAQTYYLGNHGSGILWPELPYTFEAAEDAQVAVLVSVLNDHDPNDAASKAVRVLDDISNYAEKFVQTVYPLGPVWPAVNTTIQSINGWFAGGCDGVVATDAVLGTGQTFDDWSANGTYYGGVQRHDGSNSPWYCGSTSLYFTQYSISRDW